MNKQYKKVSIIIPAYNAAKTIVYAIKGSINQNYPKKLIEIIVVDDGSTDNTKKVISHYDVKYIYQENAGPAAARNHGMRRANGDIVAFLDSDCKPRKDWISKMINAYNNESIVCVGSRYGIAEKNSLLACTIYFEFLIRYRRMPQNPKFLGSHGYSFRKDFLEKIGGYNTEYTMASHEDNELAYRITANGYQTFFDKSNIVEHFFPTSIYRYLKVQFWHGYWRMKLYVDHPRMVTGDDYSDMWDYMQPPLMLLFIILLPLAFFIKQLFLIELFILILTTALTVPITYSMIKLCGRKRYFYYILFSLLRAMARGIGMLKGIFKFWIFKSN